MSRPGAEFLPVGHRARPAAALALGISIAAAVAFTAFAFVTTQDHAVRAGSPWQDDPYDGVVSFTQFLVPTLTLLTATRALLWHRRAPQPVFRIHQLLRAAVVSTVLVAGTVTTDWLAVAMRANRRLWNHTTPWLIAALVPLTAAAAAGLLVQRRAFRRLPGQQRRRPDGDWLDDLAALTDAVAAHLPRTGRRLTARIDQGGAIQFVRSHVVAFAAAASLTAGLLVTSAEAFGEHWTSPLLFLTGTAIGTGGFFAFCMLCNTVLHIAVPRHSETARPATTARLRRATRIAAIAGAVALPTAAVLRDSIWAALGRNGHAESAERLAAVTFGGALLTGAVAFGTALLAIISTARRPP